MYIYIFGHFWFKLVDALLWCAYQLQCLHYRTGTRCGYISHVSCLVFLLLLDVVEGIVALL